jgi:tetratricopeptide (TPR) repeat protein
MVEPRRPTAEELDDLIEAFRRDPASSFVPLGNAYLALGRPRETVDVGARGLKSNPNDLAGRVMVAQAFAQLHQWKEAQAELLKVVKADRNHGVGFRLLGEVLMRRADFERALPVLQHAQNLSPADPSILSLLKRARVGQPLDAPPPVPTPMQPAGGGRRAAPPLSRPPGDGSYPLDDLPTRVAGDPAAIAEDEARLARMDLDRVEVRREGVRAPVDRGARHVDDRGRDLEGRRPVEVHAPPPLENPLAPLGADPRAAAYMPTISASPAQVGMPPAPRANSPVMPLGGQPVRPRVMPIEKPKDAAQASLRQSAAVGEDYLNHLLVGGLLEMPHVRVPDSGYDVKPDRRWGRSTFRMFIYLFVLLFMGVGGAGTWYWYTGKQRDEDVARYIATAIAEVDIGDHEGLIAADTAARAAIERDRDNGYAIAVLAEITGLETLLYRELDPAEVDKAISLAAEDVKVATDKGYRELVIARAAVALSSLDSGEDDAESRLRDVGKELDAWLSANSDDSLARWLSGEVMYAGGARHAAAVAFEQAHKGGQGSVLGTIAMADLKLDDGKYDEARALYDAALARAPKHPLAFIGRSLARSERAVDLSEAMSDLNVGVPDKVGPRVEAYKRLALATAHYGLEDFQAFTSELGEATGVDEPRFLARVGLLRVARGDLADAAAARAKIRWYADKPEADPLVQLLDAELLLARGLPAEALRQVGKLEGLRAARLRGRAMLDLGKAGEAQKELADALAVAPEDIETQTYAEAARMIASTGDERRKASDELDSLGRKAKSKAARTIHGIALARTGRLADARERLEQSLADLSDEYPNPIAYQAHVALGELDLADGKTADGVAHGEKALEQNPGYLPAHDLLGRLLIDSAPDKAREHLIEVVNAEVASAGAEIAYVKAVLPSDAAEDKDAAAKALRRAKEKGASLEALQSVFELVPAELTTELGIPAPKPAKK